MWWSYNLIGYLMLGHMGAILSMVIGNLKTPTTILLSVLIFGNQCTPMQILGFIICWTGAFLYGKHGKEIKPEHISLPKDGDSVNKNNIEMTSKIGVSPAMKDIELGDTPNLEEKGLVDSDN